MVLTGIPVTNSAVLEAAIPDAPPRIVEYNTKLWFGLHKGKTACNVPGSYLLWCERNVPNFKLTRSLRNAANYDAELEGENLHDTDPDD